jgi:NAD(P)-dependent dehydrogenase (short-subunit alcohol dehydrogenase family)
MSAASVPNAAPCLVTVPFALSKNADPTGRSSGAGAEEDAVLVEGKVAIVSGVGPGLGQAIAHALAREGAQVVLAARTEPYLREVAAEINSLGGTALAVATDITDREQCERLAATAAEELGGVDVLVNSAFVYDPLLPFEAVNLDEWRRAYEINVFGSLQVTQAALPHLKERGGGSIVFINTMSARKVRGEDGGYASSKGALLVAAQTLSKELGPHRIRVNSVLPGWMWGPPVQQYLARQVEERRVPFEELVGEITARIPLGEIPPQEDVANAVVFFASDLSRFVTGQTLDVNGGEWCA